MEWNTHKIPTLHNQFRPTAKGLEEAIQKHPQAKTIILNYPNNPSGVSLTKEEVIDLANTLEKYPDILIIIDDVYRDLNYQEQHITVLDVSPSLKDRCFVINSGAKGLLGAPGERVGMVAAHKELIKLMLPRQTNGISSVPYRTQASLRYAIDCYLHPMDNWHMAIKEEYKNNVNKAFSVFSEQGFILNKPDGAFYLLVSAKFLIGKKDPSTNRVIESDIDIANYFLNTAGVATVPGSGFGIDQNEGYIRISCAKKVELLIEAAMRMGKAAKLLLKPDLMHQSSTDGKPQFVDNLIKFGVFPTRINVTSGIEETSSEGNSFVKELN